MYSQKCLLFVLLILGLLFGPMGTWAAALPLPNGGFEQADSRDPARIAAWSAYGQGYQVDAQIHHGGTQSLRCQNPGGGQTSGAFIVWTLGQSHVLPLLITGWSRARDIDGVTDNDYSIYVDLTYTDGTAQWGQTAPFETGTHDWQNQRLMIFPSKPVRSMNIYALFRNHTGTAWFDDFAAQEVTSDALFDGQALAPPVLPRGVQGGWFVRDVAAGSPLRLLTAGRATFGLRMDGLKALRGGPIVQGTLRNLTWRDRAVTVYYVERFAASQPVWWNDIRDGVPAAEPREYANLTQAGVGATGQLSLYPFGCVTGSGKGRALGVPPWLEPRVVRIAFRPDTHLLFLACDLALTGRGDPGGHDRTQVAVVRYGVDPAWGFRDASARYYAFFPDDFRRRAKAEGIWMPFTDPAKVAGLADFHIGYHEGDNSVASDRRHGILSFRYVEPMTYWMPMAAGVQRTYPEATTLVRQLSVGSDPTARRQAQAVLSSGTKDAGGRFNVAFRDTPWCDGAVWILNPSPGVGRGTGLWTKARLNSAGEPTPGAANQPDGEYLDSLEAWADVLDYRPESLRTATETPCFAPGRDRPVLPTWFSVYEAAAALSHDLHSHGKLLMANSVPWRFSAFAPLLDVMGTETNMFTDSGAWAPEPDAVMDLRRTTSYHKPYLLLLNTDFSKVDEAKIALYFGRCLFYGIYPSMFSADAAQNPYWENPKLYNRDRPLFRRDIPIVQRLSAAGWEPVTWARSDRKGVWLERFGRTYLTVLDSEDGAVTATIRIDGPHFFPGAHGRQASILIRDAFSGHELMTLPFGPTVSVPLGLLGQETRVLSLHLISGKTLPKKTSMKGMNQ